MAKITMEQFKKWNSQAQGGFRLDGRTLATWGEKELVQQFSQDDGSIYEVRISYFPEYEEKTNSCGCKWRTETGRQIPAVSIDKLTPAGNNLYHSVKVLDYQAIGEPCNKKMYSTLCKLSGKIDVDSYLAKVQHTEKIYEEINDFSVSDDFVKSEEVADDSRENAKQEDNSATESEEKINTTEENTMENKSTENTVIAENSAPETTENAEEKQTEEVIEYIPEKSENTEKEVQTMTNTETEKISKEIPAVAPQWTGYIAKVRLTEKETGKICTSYGYTVQRTKSNISLSLKNSNYNKKYTLDVVGMTEISTDSRIDNKGLSLLDVQQMKKNQPERYAEIIAKYEENFKKSSKSKAKAEEPTPKKSENTEEIINVHTAVALATATAMKKAEKQPEIIKNTIPDPEVVEKMLEECDSDDTARIKVIRRNLQVAVAEKIKPAIVEILKEYEGKNIGKQRSKDISDKIKEKTGYYGHYNTCYQNYKYISVHIDRLSYNEDIQFNINGKTITDENGKIKLDTVTANYTADDYIHDIDGYLTEKQAKLDQLIKARDEFERLSKEISKEGIFQRIYADRYIGRKLK